MDRRRKKVFFHCPSIIFRSVQHKFSLGGLSLKQIQFSSIYEWNSYQTLVSLSLCLSLCIFRTKLRCSLVYLCLLLCISRSEHTFVLFLCLFLCKYHTKDPSVDLYVCLFVYHVLNTMQCCLSFSLYLSLLRSYSSSLFLFFFFSTNLDVSLQLYPSFYISFSLSLFLFFFF